MPQRKDKVVALPAREVRRRTYRHAALVMAAWDRLEHDDKGKRLETAAEVNRRAREQL